MGGADRFAMLWAASTIRTRVTLKTVIAHIHVCVVVSSTNALARRRHESICVHVRAINLFDAKDLLINHRLIPQMFI